MSHVHVDIVERAHDIRDQWQALVARSPSNVFLDPAALAAVADTRFAKAHWLLAWDVAAEPRTLIGVWALGVHSIAPFWPAFSSAPPYDYAFLSTPVIDPARMDEVIDAFLDAIAGSQTLPNIVRLKYLDGDSPVYAALMRALSERGNKILQVSARPRPFATKDTSQKASGSTRKKLRQDWNRLSALGAVAIVNDRSGIGAPAAFETFLAMEAAGWKGERGTALLCKKQDADFVRRFVGNLAAQGRASVALLQVDGRPIAAQVLLYCGDMAYTWKTAFDAEYGKFSPGALLVNKITEELLSSPEIAAIESCSPQGSFMEHLWPGRRATVDLLVDVSGRPSLSFLVATLGERGYVELRGLRDRARVAFASLSARYFAPRRGKPIPAPTPAGASPAGAAHPIVIGSGVRNKA